MKSTAIRGRILRRKPRREMAIPGRKNRRRFYSILLKAIGGRLARLQTSSLPGRGLEPSEPKPCFSPNNGHARTPKSRAGGIPRTAL